MSLSLEKLLEGACDIHIHAGPDVVVRKQDMDEVVQEAEKANMAALVFKNHFTETASSAHLLSKKFENIKVFGGIVLNFAVGGLNPETVCKAEKLGAKVVWMPSVDASYTIENVWERGKTPWLSPFVSRKKREDGITIFSKGTDEAKKEVKEILEIVRDKKLVLDTCHLSFKESYALCKLAKDMGIKKVVVCHPNCSVNYMSVEEQKILKEEGAYIAYAFLPMLPLFDREDPKEIAKMIKEVGAKNSLIFTDLGQMVNPTVVEGFRMFLSTLLACGLTFSELSMIAKENPKRLLDI